MWKERGKINGRIGEIKRKRNEGGKKGGKTVGCEEGCKNRVQ